MMKSEQSGLGFSQPQSTGLKPLTEALEAQSAEPHIYMCVCIYTYI